MYETYTPTTRVCQSCLSMPICRAILLSPSTVHIISTQEKSGIDDYTTSTVMNGKNIVTARNCYTKKFTYTRLMVAMVTQPK